MASLTYIATRNISSGHSSGVEYDKDFTASRLQRRVQTTRRTQRAIDGSSETLRYRDNVFFDVTVNEIAHVNMPEWREFLESVNGGELFTFDAYGTNAVPDDAATCTMDSSNYTEQRIQTTMIYNVNFRVRLE